MTHFTTDYLDTDVTAANGLARALKQSRTLKEVEVKEQLISSEVVQVLAQAMKNSNVEKLAMKRVTKDVMLSDCSYPTAKVEMSY